MKKIILAMTVLLSLSSLAGAGEIQVRTGERVTVTNIDCKTSEFTAFEQFPSAASFTVSCRPKVCETSSYLRLDGWHMKVRLLPDNKLLIDANSREEGLDAVKKFIADGVCAERTRYVPSL